MKIALSILCENPRRPTGLSTLFAALVRNALETHPEVSWLVFAGPDQGWEVSDPRVEVVRSHPANDRLWRRLVADHFLVGPEAARRGAAALLTTGFVPHRCPLPVAMQVVTLHHLGRGYSGGWLRRRYRDRVLRRGLRRARVVIANSRDTAARLAAVCPGAADRIVCSPEGLDHARFHARAEPGEAAALEQALGIRTGGVLWVSNFYAYKRADRLLTAYARLPRELRDRHPLVMVGGDWQDGHAETRRLAEHLGVPVRILGWIEERWLPVLYRHAALHVLPSEEETFGRSLLEAMACGCPCLVQDLPVLREVGGSAACAVDYADAARTAAVMAECLSDRTLALRMQADGLRQAATFGFARLARERVEAIQRHCGRP